MADQEKKEVKKERRPQAQKRDLQNQKRRLQNRQAKSRLKTAIRKLDEVKAKGDKELVKQALNEVYSLLDKSVKTGLNKLNKVSRTKSRLTARALANT